MDYNFDKKVKYLEFLQNIINRMSDDSFRCKEFCILIISAILAVFASLDNHPGILVLICVLPLIVFWFLDAYYLRQEKAFRNLYNKCACLDENDKSFDNYAIIPDASDISYTRVLFNKTIWPIYLPLLIGSITFGILLLTVWCK